MSLPQTLASAILVAALLLFVWGRFRHDVVALMVLMATVLTGLIPADQAFLGFSHPAVITVAAVLVLSQGLTNARVVDAIADVVSRFTAGPTQHMATLTTSVAGTSAFMNNVGALALLLPVTLKTCAERDRPPAMYLMPLAFASLLGGMITLIGTPPNIIVAGFREQRTGQSFGMFDFAWTGAPVTVAGLAFIIFIGWRLMPKERLKPPRAESLFEIGDYIVEMRVTEESGFAGQRAVGIPGVDDGRVSLIGIERGKIALAPFQFVRLREDDVLILRAEPKDIDALAQTGLTVIEGELHHRLDELAWENVRLLEALVPPRSKLIGRGHRLLQRLVDDETVLLAVARQGSPIRTRLQELELEAGDILLLQGEADALESTIQRLGLVPLESRYKPLGIKKRPALAVGIFAFAVVLVTGGILTAPVAFVLAAVCYVLANIVPTNELYDAIDWPVIILLGGMLPLGTALDQTGVSELVAATLQTATEGLPPWMAIAGLFGVTILLTNVINNAAAALVMAPIAYAMASRLGHNPDPYFMAVAISASAAFLTPIGHQSNILVMGPGGYRFTDFGRMGLPLSVIVGVVTVPLLLYFWPITSSS